MRLQVFEHDLRDGSYRRTLRLDEREDHVTRRARPPAATVAEMARKLMAKMIIRRFLGWLTVAKVTPPPAERQYVTGIRPPARALVTNITPGPPGGARVERFSLLGG